MPYLYGEPIKIVPKEWGAEFWVWNNNGYCGKILKLRQAHYCSYHAHKNKTETFYILSGKVKFTLNGEERTLVPGDRVHIIPLEYHSFEGLQNSEIMEVSTFHADEDSYRKTVSGRRLRVVVDIDGVIAEESHSNIFTTDYSRLKTVKGTKEALLKLHRAGTFIVLHTARRPELETITKCWLAEHRIMYDDLVFGKPSGDVYIDDRALKFNGWDKCLKSILPKKSQ